MVMIPAIEVAATISIPRRTAVRVITARKKAANRVVR
jgi:hypothetical protein